MAIDLGDVNFRLGVDSRNLGKAVRDLKSFGRAVDTASQQTGKAAQSTARALRQQEKAASDALRSVINMNSKFRQYDFGAKSVRQANTAFRKYNQALTSGKLSAVDFARAQNQFKNSIAATNREFSKLKTASAAPTKEVGRLNQLMRELSATSVLISGPLGGVTARLNTLTALSKSSGLAIAGLTVAVAAGVAGFLLFGRSMVTAGRQMERYDQMLVSVAGDQRLANVRLESAIKIARNTGQTLESVIPSYAKFLAASKGTSLEGAKSEEIFNAVGLAMARMQAPAEQTQGVFKALEQMMSKGLVQAEELRGQLGDRLPGAFQIAARAMGVTTAELVDMTKKGELLTEDFLPKFAAELRRTFDLEGVTSVDNFTASWNNMLNAWTLLMARFDDITGASRKVKKSMDAVTLSLDTLRENADVLVGSMGALVGASLAMAGPTILAGLGRLLVIIRNLTTATAALTAAMLANPAGRLASVFIKLATAIGGATAGYLAFKNLVSDTGETFEQATAAVDNFISTQKLMNSSSDEVTKQYISDTQKRIKAMEKEYEARKRTLAITDTTGPSTTVFGQFEYVTEGQRQFVLLGESIRKAKEQLAQLDAIATQVSGGGSLELNLTENFDKSKESIDEMLVKITELQRVMYAGRTGGLDALIHAEDLAKAREELSKLNSDELSELKNHLEQSGVAGKNVVDQIANLISKQRELTDSISEFKDKVNDTSAQESLLAQAQAMNSFNRELEIMSMQIDAFEKGSKAVKELNDELAESAQVEKYALALKEAGYSFETINAKIDEFRAKSEELKTAQENFDKTEAAISAMADLGGRSMDNLGDIVARDIGQMKLGFETLADVVSTVAADIIKTLFQLAVTNPLKDAMFGTSSASIGSGFLGSIFSGLFSGFTGMSMPSPATGAQVGGLAGGGFAVGAARNGDAFGTLKAANGILSKPTIMNTSAGPVLGGEAGQEAIMPLDRDSSGQLGVKANLGGKSGSGVESVTVNIYGAKGEVEQEQRRDGSNLTIDLMFRQIENRMSEQISKGGTKLNRAMERRYGVNSVAGNQQ